MKLKVNLHTVVGHPYLPGEAEAPEVFVAIEMSEAAAFATAMKATLLFAQKKTEDPEMPRYAIDRVVIPIEINPLWGIASFLVKKLFGVLTGARKASEK